MNAEEALELLQMQLDSESEEYDDEDRDPSYSLPKARQSSDTESCDKDTDQLDDSRDSTPPSPSQHEVPQHTEDEPVTAPPRKKKRLRTEKERNERDTISHGVKDGCGDACKMACNQKFTIEQRHQINKSFWELTLDERRKWVWSNVRQIKSKRTTTQGDSRRGKTFQYQLRKVLTEDDGSIVNVCKVFFLTTLGYNKRSDGVIMRILNSAPPEALSPAPDMRGKHAPKNNIDVMEIQRHIKSFNPVVHHYRREHAPNRLYLPSDITITDMHKDFCQNVFAISRESYRKQVAEMNISFAVLGGEECETCKKFNIHSKTKDPDCDCDTCKSQTDHNRQSEFARKAYKRDQAASLSSQTNTTSYASVDLQKVIMLPRLPGVKSCMFTKRIIAFNETFAALGAAGKNTTVVWHEAIAGRLAQDICSTYWNFFVEKQRDTEHIVLWADNCSAQNKNWQFFTFLASAVNSNWIAAKTIRMNYLVTGHTFMSADSVHSAIERELKKKGDCCDWQDFTSVLEMPTVGSSTWQCKIFWNGVMVQTSQQYLGVALNWQIWQL